MKLKVSAAVAASVLGSPTMAEPAFEGFYGQVAIGYNDISPKADNVSATILNGPYAGTYARTSTLANTSEFSAAVTLGYMAAISDKLYLGLGVDYSFIAGGNNDIVTVGSTGGLNSTYRSSYKVLNHLNVFLSPAYAIDQDKLVYGKIGYSQSDSDFQFAGAQSPVHTATGYVLGIGYRQFIQGGWYGYAEGNYFIYTPKTYDFSGVGPLGSFTASQSVTLNGYNLLVGIGYKF
jgi:outer membrane immunogenic protein